MNNLTSASFAAADVKLFIPSVTPPYSEGMNNLTSAAAKEADVKLFIPSEYGGVTDGKTEGVPGVKANIQGKLRALGMPYAAFYTGVWSDYAWVSYVS